MSADVSEVIQAMERVAQVLLRGCNISIGLFFCKKGVINFLRCLFDMKLTESTNEFNSQFPFFMMSTTSLPSDKPGTT